MITQPNPSGKVQAGHTLVAFVVRGRRIEAHSLAQDRAQLTLWARGHMTIRVARDGQRGEVHYNHPPEEQTESAAARIRPVILQDDPTFHVHALNAMGYFAHLAKDDSLASSVERLRSHWAQLRETKAIRGYSVQFADTSTGARSEMLSDSVLAYAWIYGDTVHADSAHRARTAALGVEERYRAAVPLVCQIMICTINTLGVIRAAVGRGSIELPGAALTDAVVATGKPEIAEMRLFQAGIEPNTPSPELDEVLGYQWPEFRPPPPPDS